MIKSTKIQADSAKELTALMIKLKDIGNKWCENHPNYEYELKANNKDLTIDFKVNKL